MRIGLFSDTFPPEINGVANSTNILFHQLRKHGHEAYVITTRKGGAGISEWNEDHTVLRLAGIELKQLYGYVMTSPFHLNALNEVKKLNLDIIHVQTEFGVGIFARICAKQLNIPLVSTFHTTYEDYTHYVNFLDSESFDAAAKKAVGYLTKLYGDSSVEVIAPSEKTKDLLLRYKVRPKINVVPTGLDLEKYQPKDMTVEKRHEIRSTYGIGDKDPMVIYVGRIAEEKSLDLVIEGFEQAKKNGTRIRLLIVGGGPDLERFQQFSQQKNLSDMISFAGPKPAEEVPYYYCSADAFISASLSETQGMTFIEAMAAGLPLFARKDVVLKDLLIDKKTGWYFESPEDLAVKLAEFTKLSSETLAAMHSECLKQVQPYSSESFYEKAMDVYASAINTFKNMMVIDDVHVKGTIVEVNLTSPSPDVDDEQIIMTLDDYYNAGMRKGVHLSDARIKELQAQQGKAEIYEKCLHHISVKDRSVLEMRQWLRRTTQLSEEDIQSLIEKMIFKGYLDDNRYCDEEIARMKAQLYGNEHIVKTLKAKGLNEEVVRDKLGSQQEDQLDNAESLARRALKSIKDISVKTAERKIYNKLIQKGYTSDVAREAVKDLDFAALEKSELSSLKKCAVKAKKRYEKKYSGTTLRNNVFRYCLSQGYEDQNIYAVMDEMEWDDD